ncbi:MAG: alanine--tRNA ligase [Clostridia bacterium]|nr:alanine--tRNA ligase [Clostridia bacterium]
MKYMGLNEIREKYLSFFESKDHLRLNSFSLVPQNDKSLLLINSGMAPMKKFFTGEVKPPRNRVTTCQKCIRTPDLERVGHTARHGTYFEMLGNFSFGDYFKEQAIQWAWEFLTETMEIPAELLWPSIYESDEEAYVIWKDQIGIPEERIVRLGKADNFWEHGTGPCGPCSEIYFDRGEKYGCGSPDCKPGCECDRYMEIWNNVFSQFNNMGDGTYTELETKNIDTGMGLERLACVIQGVDNMFEVDTIRNILDRVCEIADVTYGKDAKNDISIRAITDHARASTFMICDGVIPSNEGRGYVLRRLIRRAARHGKLLGIDKPFLQELCDVVIRENKAGYPELVEKESLIKKVISYEEAAFAKTIDQGLSILEELIKKGGVLSGADAFKLYDTYGFPLDLTRDILQEKGMTVDEEGFAKLMEEQRNLARDSRKASDGESWKSDEVSLDGIEKTAFLGYEMDSNESSILALIADGERKDTVLEGEKAVAILGATAFYGEGGGQVGDSGIIETENARFVVENTTKNASGVFMHLGKVESGALSVGDQVCASIDAERRIAIRRNHTAAHLLQAALREVLGNHVEQAGQLVNERAVRFDFTHFSAMNAEELNAVEKRVNEIILSGIEVLNYETSIEEAREKGAMALFGEKYGDRVRVVEVPNASIELCGGTHIQNTGKMGLFKIIGENGVASGVRRIEAVTGSAVLDLLDQYQKEIGEAAAALKCNSVQNLIPKCRSLMEEVKTLNNALAVANKKMAEQQSGAMFENAPVVDGVQIVTATLKDGDVKTLRELGDDLKANHNNFVAVLANICGEKGNLLAVSSKEAIDKGILAGKLIAMVAGVTGGKGGGKPDSAMAGMGDVSKAADALSQVEAFVRSMMK